MWKISERNRKALSAIGGVILWFSCFLLTGCGQSRQLNLFIWSEYIDPEVIREFEKRHQCPVVIDVYEDAESMLAKMQGGGVSRYDVVVPPDYIVPAMIQLELLAPLRHNNIPNMRHLEEKFVDPPFDAGNRYTVAYQWGTLGIYIRQQQPVEAGESQLASPTRPEPTWGLIFDPALQPESFVLIDSVRDMIGAALQYQGAGLNSTDPEELKAARDLILEAKRRAIGFAGSVEGKNKVLSKVAQAAVVYSGEAVRGMEDDPQTQYLIPKEGSQIWVDNLAVPAQAPHRDLAESFINFVLEPEIGARISNYTRFATPNRKARSHIDSEDLQNPAIYPPAEVRDKLKFLKDLGKATRLYDEIWTQIKTR